MTFSTPAHGHVVEPWERLLAVSSFWQRPAEVVDITHVRTDALSTSEKVESVIHFIFCFASPVYNPVYIIEELPSSSSDDGICVLTPVTNQISATANQPSKKT